MSRPDSLESIRKDYKHFITINGREGGILQCWVIGFKDVTMVCLWVEFPDCDGNLTPIDLPIEPHTEGEQTFIDIAGKITIYNIEMPDNWHELKLLN